MSRVIHFEIETDDMNRAKKFYEKVFGWKYIEYEGFGGYVGISTGDDEKPGINGGLYPRETGSPTPGEKHNSYICTMLVEDYDAAREKILAAGGVEVSKKFALEGMAWQGYYRDTEGNLFGIHQPDENAK